MSFLRRIFLGRRPVESKPRYEHGIRVDRPLLLTQNEALEFIHLMSVVRGFRLALGVAPKEIGDALRAEVARYEADRTPAVVTSEALL
jgi:hypothetical protein